MKVKLITDYPTIEWSTQWMMWDQIYPKKAWRIAQELIRNEFFDHPINFYQERYYNNEGKLQVATFDEDNIVYCREVKEVDW